MARKITIYIIFIFLMSGCSRFREYDNLYEQGLFYDAYVNLSAVSKKETFDYQKRMIQIITRIALDGDSDFISLLKNWTTNESNIEVYSGLSNYMYFGKTYLDYYAGEDSEDYNEVISNLTPMTYCPSEFQSFGYKIRGISMYQIGEYLMAISDLENSYRIEPYVDNYYYIGMCYYNLSQYDEALDALSMVTDYTKNDFLKSLAYYQKGEIYYNSMLSNSTENYEMALEEYIKAVNLHSESATYNYKIAKCLQKLGHDDTFFKFLKASLRIEPEYANAWYYLNIN